MASPVSAIIGSVGDRSTWWQHTRVVYFCTLHLDRAWSAT